jgi:hypothetical protein
VHTIPFFLHFFVFPEPTSSNMTAPFMVGPRTLFHFFQILFPFFFY